MAMIFTHIIIGIFFSLYIHNFLFNTQPMEIYLLTGIISSILPDFDIFYTHRKTFHSQLIPIFILILNIILFLVMQNYFLLGILIIVLLSFSSHLLLDYFGHGDIKKPWKNNSNKTIYSYIKGGWLNGPSYYYDGSFLDLLITIFFTVTVFYIATENILFILIGTNLFLAILYTLSRKKIPELSDEEKFSDNLIKGIKNLLF